MQNIASQSSNQTEVPFPNTYVSQFVAEQNNLAKQTSCNFGAIFDEEWMPRKNVLQLRYHDDRGAEDNFWSEAQRQTTITSSSQMYIPYKIPRFDIPDDALQMDKEMW